jgi:ABC-2 type transport system permease protein
MTVTMSAAGPDAAAAIVPGDRPAGPGATALAVATRTVLRYLRTPELLGFGVVSSAIFLVLFRYIFGGAIDVGTVPYVDFLVPGFVLTGTLITATGVAAGVAEDGALGFLDRLRSLPVPRLALAGGRVLGDTLVVAWSSAVSVAMGFAVGFRVHGSLADATVAFGLCVVCGSAFLWVFVYMGLVSRTAQGAQGLTMITYPVVFVSSAYVPVGTLPGWMQAVAAHQPVTVMSNAVRSLALGDPARAGLGHSTAYWVLLSLVWAGGIVAVFAPLAALRYSRSP